MEGDPFGLIEAMAIAGFALGASKGYIYVRSEYPIAIKILKAAIEIAKPVSYTHLDVYKRQDKRHR